MLAGVAEVGHSADSGTFLLEPLLVASFGTAVHVLDGFSKAAAAGLAGHHQPHHAWCRPVAATACPAPNPGAGPALSAQQHPPWATAAAACSSLATAQRPLPAWEWHPTHQQRAGAAAAGATLALGPSLELLRPDVHEFMARLWHGIAPAQQHPGAADAEGDEGGAGEPSTSGRRGGQLAMAVPWWQWWTATVSHPSVRFAIQH